MGLLAGLPLFIIPLDIIAFFAYDCSILSKSASGFIGSTGPIKA